MRAIAPPRASQNAPNAKVSIGWGGWQTRWDDPASGGGKSLIPYFADVMSQMDFQSFQAMQDDMAQPPRNNITDVQNMTATLGAYGPVMLAHYKPQDTNDTVFNTDISTMMTAPFLDNLVAHGLFAWSFMDQDNFNDMTNPLEAANFDLVKNAVLQYGRSP